MAVTITHTTPADGTFSATGAAAWDANHAVSGLGTMAEQDANNVNITGGSITGVTGVLTGLTVNSTPTSGGAAGQIMFDTGSVLQESSNLVWDNTNKKLTITGATVTTSQPVLDMTQTWNNAGVTFTGLKFNATDTASASASLLMDLQVGGVSKASIKKNGDVITTSSFSASSDSYAGRYMWITGTSGYFTINGNTILSRKAAANWRFGAADAATPVAQTLSVQSVVAGTSNTAGANLTITGSQGTGTGAGGSIIFQVAPAGSSGTAQNALVNAFQIIPTSSANITANHYGNTGVLFLQHQSVNLASVYYSSGVNPITEIGRYGLYFNSTNQFSWASSSTNCKSGIDLYLRRRGAANLQFGAADAAAPVAQTLSVQSVVAGTSNTPGANLTITGSQGTGTGAGGDIVFQVATAGTSGTSQNALAAAWTIKSTKVTQQALLTVATLPTGAAGMRAFVSDSSVAGSGNFGATVAGGGANNVPVYFDGTNWCIG